MPVVLMNSSYKTTVSAAASTLLKNFPHLAVKMADHGTPNQEMSASANGSCAIRTAISQYLSWRILETSEMFEHLGLQCASIIHLLHRTWFQHQHLKHSPRTSVLFWYVDWYSHCGQT